MNRTTQLGYHYRVRETNVIENETIRKEPCIVIADDETRAILKVTPWADYILRPQTRDYGLHTANLPALYAVVQFLNFIFIDNSDTYGITSMSDITISMVYDFLKSYSNKELKNGKRPLRSSISQKRNAISLFLLELTNDKSIVMKNIKPSDLLNTAKLIRAEGEQSTIYQYKIHIAYDKTEQAVPQLWRDMPMDIVERFIKTAYDKDPEIALAIILMAYAGLRVSEICNLRRPDSCHAPNLLFMYSDFGDEADSLTINLTEIRQLRSDKKYVGGIKRPRNHPVAPSFANTIFQAYKFHLTITEDRVHEPYGPLFITKYKSSKTGKYLALTSPALRKRIIKLFNNYVLPSLENDANPEFRRFYSEMQNHTWGPHSFRHWFTVLLVLQGYDRADVQTYRGDKSPESSERYLERKGSLERLAKESAERIGRMIRDSEEESK